MIKMRMTTTVREELEGLDVLTCKSAMYGRNSAGMNYRLIRTRMRTKPGSTFSESITLTTEIWLLSDKDNDNRTASNTNIHTTVDQAASFLTARLLRLNLSQR